MLTLDELQQALDEMTHPPGWSVTIEADHWGQPIASFRATVPNARRTGTVGLHITSNVPYPIADGEALARWVKQRHGVIALHEVDEYVTYQGEPLHDPHGQIAPIVQLVAQPSQ